MISGRKATINLTDPPQRARGPFLPLLVTRLKLPPDHAACHLHWWLVWPPSHLGLGGATECGTCLAVAGGSKAAGARGIGDHMYCTYNTVYGGTVLFLSFCWDSGSRGHKAFWQAFSSFHQPNVVAASYSKYPHQLTSIQLVVHFAAI